MAFAATPPPGPPEAPFCVNNPGVSLAGAEGWGQGFYKGIKGLLCAHKGGSCCVAGPGSQSLAGMRGCVWYVWRIGHPGGGVGILRACCAQEWRTRCPPHRPITLRASIPISTALRARAIRIAYR